MVVKVKKLPNDDDSGVLTLKELKKTPGFPKENDFDDDLIAVIECDEDIPCNPCESICPNNAIKVGEPITNLPAIDSLKCNGCLKCIGICPGLCIFAIKKNFSQKEALVFIPYEYSPLPEKGMLVKALDRRGEYICDAKVNKIIKSSKKQNSLIIGIIIPKKFYNTVRHFELFKTGGNFEG
jgi:Fe-S-cluster-containing hydrogenase component 2